MLQDISLCFTNSPQFVEAIRGRELGLMKSRVKYSVVMTFIWSCSPILVTIVTIVTIVTKVTIVTIVTIVTMVTIVTL